MAGGGRGRFWVTLTASVWKRAPAAWAMAESSAMGWMTPVSLFAYMMLTSLVLGGMAALRAAGSMRPSGVEGRKVTSTFRFASDSAAWRTAWCSMVVVMRWVGSPWVDSGERTPKRARLSLSVP